MAALAGARPVVLPSKRFPERREWPMNEQQARDDELAKIRSEATSWLAKMAKAQQRPKVEQRRPEHDAMTPAKK
jgi:hypothetical protein